MHKWLFHQNGFTRTSLSATVTRVSNFVEENVFLLYIVKAMSLRQSLLLFIIFLTTCNSILSSNIIGKLRQNKDCYTLINTNKPSTVLPAKSDSDVIFVYNC